MDGGVSTLLRVENEFVINGLKKKVDGRKNSQGRYFRVSISPLLLDLRYMIDFDLSS
jgi:hypothetical protein